MTIYTKKEIEDFGMRWIGKELLINEIIRILRWQEFRKERALYKIVEMIENANILLTESGFRPIINSVQFFLDYRVPSLDLRGINLQFKHCEGMVLVAASLEGANMRWAHLEAADFRKAHLEGSSLQNSSLEGASFFETYLEGADIRSVRLHGARFSKTCLAGANLTNAKLGPIVKFNDECELSQENKESIKNNTQKTTFYFNKILPNWVDHFHNGIHWKDLCSHIFNRLFYTNFSDVRIDDADTVMAPDLYRYVKDQQYLLRFKKIHPWIYRLWKVFSDCGGRLSWVSF